MENEEKFKIIKYFEGEAKIGEVLQGFENLVIKPEDLASPVSFQMAITRMIDTLMKSMSEGTKKKYIAEIRFKDSTGNPVIVAVDLGENKPLFTSDKVKARILIELYEE
ncbi:MAG: hypothetical protein B6U89_00250 [Desulfurococcales archaeon ex4484_58]|nr:MAG: hypothetical protein B6U89_00250 [Desulfurococcales archaeon ex4484_58]